MTDRRASAGGAPAPRRPAARTIDRRVSAGGAPAPRRPAARTIDRRASAGGAPAPRRPAARTTERPAGSRHLRTMTVRLVGLVSIVWTLAAFAPAPYSSPILFPAGAHVPRPVQELAWRVIETRCSYQQFEREQRTFWAYDTRATKLE